jgi:hypothetical protein
MNNSTQLANSQVITALRKSNAGAAYRIRNAPRVNKETNWCVPSGLTVQARDIAQARKA